MAQYYTRASWKKFRGKTRWNGDGPGSGLIHTECGCEIKEFVQGRSVWEDDLPVPGGSGRVVEVGVLACTKCDGEPKLISYGHPIMKSEFFDPTKEPTSCATD